MNLFYEFEKHLMNDENPSFFFEEFFTSRSNTETYPYNMLWDLTKVPQSPKYHPEGSVWRHTLLVLDHTAKRKHLSENPRIFLWAALLHDLGKVPATKIKNGKITSYDHDRFGEGLSLEFLNELTDDESFKFQVSKMVRWHMQILYVTKGLPFANVKKMYEQVSIKEIALLGLCDRLGRGDMSAEKEKDEEKCIKIFIEKCQKITKNQPK